MPDPSSPAFRGRRLPGIATAGVATAALATAVLSLSLPARAAAQGREPPPPASLPTAPLPTEPVRVAPRWPDPAFAADHQCRGSDARSDATGYLPAVGVARWLPGVRAVGRTGSGRCVVVAVTSEGTGRLVELILRGMRVPRRAVRLDLAGA